MNQQRNRAIAQITGEKPVRNARFVKTSGGKKSFDEAAYARAQQVAGLKGYVTNMSVERLDGAGVIAAYHDLWHVEQSFRMSKRPPRPANFCAHTRPHRSPPHGCVLCPRSRTSYSDRYRGVDQEVRAVVTPVARGRGEYQRARAARETGNPR